jgi:hypothetical protein
VRPLLLLLLLLLAKLPQMMSIGTFSSRVTP